jgi:hypothetical protein
LGINNNTTPRQKCRGGPEFLPGTKKEDRMSGNVNKTILNVIERVEWITEQLLSNRPFNSSDVIARFGVNEKTARRYLAAIKAHYGWDIKFHVPTLTYHLKEIPHGRKKETRDPKEKSPHARARKPRYRGVRRVVL